MDYPLNNEELKEVEYCIMKSTNYRIPSNIGADLERNHSYAVKFLFDKGFLINKTYLRGSTTDWCKDGKLVRLACSKEEAIKELRRCNKKSKMDAKREWKIDISSAIIGGLFGIISTVISTKIIG